jgi:cyanophycinase
MKKPTKAKGTLIIIGGHEDKEGESAILKEVAKHIKGEKLVIATVASEEPEDYFADYQKAFARLDVNGLTHLYIQDRGETTDPDKLKLLENVKGIFFSGGDQLRISSQIGDTPFETRIQEIYKSGGLIAGTSAGASVMGETMLIRGPNSESHRIGDLHMAPGLRLIRNVIIDQHFAERGRIGRLLGAVALNPRILGIGIDEDTAIVVKGRQFCVIGKGAVYVVEGASVTHSNIAEAENKRTLSMFDVRLHILSDGDCFSLSKRRPISAPSLEKSKKLEELAAYIKNPRKSNSTKENTLKTGNGSRSG